jgi:hypothetical protein
MAGQPKAMFKPNGHTDGFRSNTNFVTDISALPQLQASTDWGVQRRCESQQHRPNLETKDAATTVAYVKRSLSDVANVQFRTDAFAHAHETRLAEYLIRAKSFSLKPLHFGDFWPKVCKLPLLRGPISSIREGK